MDDDLYGGMGCVAVAEGALDASLYEGLFAETPGAHHDTYLQHKVNELEDLLRESKAEARALGCQLVEREQQLAKVTSQRDNLLRNISCLFTTAKEEMARKQADINNLRVEVALGKQQQHSQRDQQQSPALFTAQGTQAVRLALPQPPPGPPPGPLLHTGGPEHANRDALDRKRGRDCGVQMEGRHVGQHGSLGSAAEGGGAKRSRCGSDHAGRAENGATANVGKAPGVGTANGGRHLREGTIPQLAHGRDDVPLGGAARCRASSGDDTGCGREGRARSASGERERSTDVKHDRTHDYPVTRRANGAQEGGLQEVSTSGERNGSHRSACASQGPGPWYGERERGGGDEGRFREQRERGGGDEGRFSQQRERERSGGDERKGERDRERSREEWNSGGSQGNGWNGREGHSKYERRYDQHDRR